MSKYFLLFFFIVASYLSTGFLYADESQSINEIIVKVNQFKEKNNYDEIIRLIKGEIDKGSLHQLYFDILGGAYAGKKNFEESYLAYLRGHYYNPTTEYSKNQLIKKMNYIENRPEELEKDSWLYKYLQVKKLFDDGDIINADKKLSELSSENKNLDLLCIINKDIKSFKDIPKDTKNLLVTFSEAESMFNRVISEQGGKCPEYVYYEFADLLYKTNKYTLALENYKISVSKNPLRRDNLLKVGICQLYSKNYKEAKIIFLSLIEKNANYIEANLYLGFSHWALKESDKAIKSFSNVVEMSKSSNSILKDKAKKAIEVVKKGDLFLTPNDMDKIIKGSQPSPNQKTDPPDNKNKEENKDKEKPKGKEEHEQPADKK